jgi:hypothetical protein
LFVLIDRQVVKLAHRSGLSCQRTKCRSLISAPDSKVEDHADAQAKGTHRKPYKTTFEDILLPTSIWNSEKWNHPLIKRERQHLMFRFDLAGASGFAGPGQADRHVKGRARVHGQSFAQLDPLSADR